MMSQTIRRAAFHLGALSLALLSGSPFAFAKTAALEVRAPLGVQLANPSELNNGLVSELQVKEVLSFGADVLVLGDADAPAALQNWAVGLRYDSLSSFRIYAEDRLELAAHVFSLLAQYRWHFDNVYVAPMASYGFANPSVINYKQFPADWVQYKADKVRSAAIGVEGGWISDIYLLAGEIGYQTLTLDGLATDNGTPLQTPGGVVNKADFSGPYLKFILGLHF